MAVDYKELESLQELLVLIMKEELAYYRKEEIPVPAADKAVIVKFLKDNAVVAVPKTAVELDALREEFKNTPRGGRLAQLRREIGDDLDGDDSVIRLQ